MSEYRTVRDHRGVARGWCPYCGEHDRRLCDCLVGHPERIAALEPQ